MSDDNLLRDVFPDALIERWAKVANSSREFQSRLDVVRGLNPRQEIDEYVRRWFDLRRAFWCEYLKASLEIGHLDSDVRARLASVEDSAFHAALSECMAIWFLTRKLGLRVEPGAPGTRGKPDLRVWVADGEVTCEVKAPHRRKPRHLAFFQLDDDRAAVAGAVDEASRQLEPGRNLLLLAPSLRMPLRREDLISSLVARPVFRIPIALDPGVRPEDLPSPEFDHVTDRKLTKVWAGVPRFTRISAVFSLEEQSWGPVPGTGEIQIVHRVYVVHNPYAVSRLAPSSFGDFPQFVESEIPGEWHWVGEEPSHSAVQHASGESEVDSDPS